MKKLCTFLMAAFLALGASALDPSTSTGTYSAVGTPKYTDFYWTWSGLDYRNISAQFNGVSGLSNVLFRLAWPERGGYYLTVQNGVVTQGPTSAVWQTLAPIAPSNIPPIQAQPYFAEFLGVASNGQTRTLAAGRVAVNYSLYMTTNAARFTPVNVIYTNFSGLTFTVPTAAVGWPELASTVSSYISNTQARAVQTVSWLEGTNNTVSITGTNLSVTFRTNYLSSSGSAGSNGVQLVAATTNSAGVASISNSVIYIGTNIPASITSISNVVDYAQGTSPIVVNIATNIRGNLTLLISGSTIATGGQWNASVAGASNLASSAQTTASNAAAGVLNVGLVASNAVSRFNESIVTNFIITEYTADDGSEVGVPAHGFVFNGRRGFNNGGTSGGFTFNAGEIDNSGDTDTAGGNFVFNGTYGTTPSIALFNLNAGVGLSSFIVSNANIRAPQGTVYAAAFNGDGSALTGLPTATNFVAKMGDVMTGGLTNRSADGFVGNGAGLTNLNASSFASGTLSASRLPATVLISTITTNLAVPSLWGGNGWSVADNLDGLVASSNALAVSFAYVRNSATGRVGVAIFTNALGSYQWRNASAMFCLPASKTNLQSVIVYNPSGFDGSLTNSVRISGVAIDSTFQFSGANTNWTTVNLTTGGTYTATSGTWSSGYSCFAVEFGGVATSSVPLPIIFGVWQ